MKRLRIHSPDAMKGRLFVQFIAQILASGIRNTMDSAELDEKYTLPELMNEMKSFNRVSVDGRRKSILSKLSKAQAEILSAFNIKTNSYV
jgi:transposase